MKRDGQGTKFTLDRKIFSSDIWYGGLWKLKIWIYLIGSANHADGEYMGVPIKRGQLIRSYRRIAADCAYKIGYRLKKPSISTIKDVCEDLTKELRIERRTVHCGTLFTICNYNKLQPMKKYEANDEPTSTRTLTEQNNNNKNIYKYSKKVQIPENIQLIPVMIEYAESKGIRNGVLPGIFEKFCIHHRQHGSMFKNWYAAWQKWILKHIEFNQSPSPKRQTQPPLEELIND